MAKDRDQKLGHDVSVALYQAKLRERRLREEEWGWEPISAARNVSSPQDVEESALNSATLKTVIQKMMPREETIFNLVFEQGLTYDEAGDVLGVSGERLRQIVGRLRERVKSDFGDDSI